MNIYHIDYTTKTHDMMASIIATSEDQARKCVEMRDDFEYIKAVLSESIQVPHIVRDSGWRKEALR